MKPRAPSKPSGQTSPKSPGDRVAYAMHRGSYAEYTVVPAAQLVKIPDVVDFNTAAAAMLQGMTAHYLTHSTFPPEDRRYLPDPRGRGRRGRPGRADGEDAGRPRLRHRLHRRKGAIARSAGADEVIVYTEQDFASEVKRLTGGRGVDVVYDSVGKTTFEKSLNCLRPRGMMALFGQSSGAVPPFDPNILNGKGSLFLTRPSLAHYCSRAKNFSGARATCWAGWAPAS